MNNFLFSTLKMSIFLIWLNCVVLSHLCFMPRLGDDGMHRSSECLDKANVLVPTPQHTIFNLKQWNAEELHSFLESLGLIKHYLQGFQEDDRD
jgi:hypothetical protein